MPQGLSDTDAEIERLQFQILREMPLWRKAQLLDEIIMATRELSLAGLRNRFPHATAAELQRRLAKLVLGPELAAKVYGPEPSPPTLR